MWFYTGCWFEDTFGVELGSIFVLILSDDSDTEETGEFVNRDRRDKSDFDAIVDEPSS